MLQFVSLLDPRQGVVAVGHQRPAGAGVRVFSPCERDQTSMLSHPPTTRRSILSCKPVHVFEVLRLFEARLKSLDGVQWTRRS